MADAIICLGDTFLHSKTIENMRLRTAKAVELYKSGKARKIIFTGGYKTKKDLSEAKFMAALAIKSGISADDIILEENANTTIENARYSHRIMDAQGWQSAIVVTSPHHMKRAKYIFQRILTNKKLEFEVSKNGLRFFEAIPYYADEIVSLLRLKIKGLR